MAAKGSVLFMRHAETTGNTEFRLAGQRDYPLTLAGEAQSKLAAEALVAWRPDRIFTSSLERTRCIGEPAAQELGIVSTIDDRIIELGFGEWEGYRLDDLPALGRPYPWQRGEDGLSLPSPGGERYEDAIARAKDFACSVASLEGKTACVSHGGFIRALFAAVYDLPFEVAFDHALENVSSFIFQSDGEKLRLTAANLRPYEIIERASSNWNAIGR